MLVRTDTPEAWLTCGLVRARRDDFFHHFRHERQRLHRHAARRAIVRAIEPRVLPGDQHAFLDRLRIMRADHRTDPVL